MTRETEKRTRHEPAGGSDTRRSGVSAPDRVVSGDDTIQSAVDSASAGDVISIEPGTYTEQVVVDEQVTLVGAGRGQTTVRAPSSLSTQFARDDTDFRPVVALECDGAKLWNLTVDGARRGRGNVAFVGIGSHDASVSLEHVEVTRLGEDPPDGARHGFGIVVYNADGAERQTEVKNCEVHGYQRGGIVGDGAGLSFYVEESRVAGGGAAVGVRQNGIQVSDVDRATVVGNTITDNYHEESTFSSGVAVLHSTDIFVGWNTIERNDIGITAQGTDDAVVRRNNFQSNGMGVLNLGAEPFDATNNWWGADDGPSTSSVGDDDGNETVHEAWTPPDGSGDAVYNVEWNPYSDVWFDLYGSHVDRRQPTTAKTTEKHQSNWDTDTR